MQPIIIQFVPNNLGRVEFLAELIGEGVPLEEVLEKIKATSITAQN